MEGLFFKIVHVMENKSNRAERVWEWGVGRGL